MRSRRRQSPTARLPISSLSSRRRSGRRSRTWASDRLTDSAVCLVAAEHGPDRQLERLLAGAGRITTPAKPILEVNPRHPRIVSLSGLGEDDKRFKDDAAYLLLDEARVLDGERPADARGFSDRLARVLGRGLRTSG
jgi:molecular chaperone HtpG